jgi:hypothetical protein
VKTFATSALSVVGTGLLFALGWYLGNRQGYSERMNIEVQSSYGIELGVSRAQIAAKLLDDLQAGDVSKVRDDLLLRLCGDLQHIDRFRHLAHPLWRKQADDLFAFVAERQTHWPTNTTDSLAGSNRRALQWLLDKHTTNGPPK